jgi:hypothetical protein
VIVVLLVGCLDPLSNCGDLSLSSNILLPYLCSSGSDLLLLGREARGGEGVGASHG